MEWINKSRIVRFLINVFVFLIVNKEGSLDFECVFGFIVRIVIVYNFIGCKLVILVIG